MGRPAARRLLWRRRRRRGKVFLGTPPLSRGRPERERCRKRSAAPAASTTSRRAAPDAPDLSSDAASRPPRPVAAPRGPGTGPRAGARDPPLHLAHLARAAASKIGLRNRGAGSPSTPASTGDAVVVGPRAARPSSAPWFGGQTHICYPCCSKPWPALHHKPTAGRWSSRWTPRCSTSRACCCRARAA